MVVLQKKEMQQMVQGQKIQLEAALVNEIKEIDRRIEVLRQEQKSIERLLLKVRAENVGGQDVTRRNSSRRILVESAIINTLNEYGAKGTTAPTLYSSATRMVPRLNGSTFRSYLLRMKMRGIISKNNQGRWFSVEQTLKR